MNKIIIVLLTVLLVSCSDATFFIGDSIEGIESKQIIDTEKPNLLLVGDSRVQLWEESYFTDSWDVCNVGKGGTTSYYSAHAIQTQDERFDTIIISVGINDLGHFMSYEDSITCIQACVDRAKEKSSKVFITTIPGVNFGGLFPDYSVTDLSIRANEVSKEIEKIAEEENITVIPLAQLLNVDIYLNPIYDDSTGIHYNESAYEKMYELYCSYIN